MTRVVTFADGFTSASAPDVVGGAQESYPIPNNQAVASAISGLSFDSADYKSVFFDYEIERVGDVTYRQTGSFMIAFNSSWEITFGNYMGDVIISDSLDADESVVLSVDSFGQIKAQSGDLSGHIESNLKLSIVRIVA